MLTTAAAAVTIVGVWSANATVALPLAVGLAALDWLGARSLARAAMAVVCLVLLGGAAAARSSPEQAALAAGELGEFTGWAEVALEPDTYGAATRVVLSVDGQRYETWVRGRARQLRVATWTAGDRVWVDGERRPLAADRAGRVGWQHVVGRFEADVLGNRRQGTRLATATNRLRAVLSAGTATLGSTYAPLADGLIYGNDRQQSESMVTRFRASGLSHLVAVSGQNVAFVLAAAGPLLTRLRGGARLTATVAVIGWFVLLTRAEPSILRAGTMAAMSALAFALGRERAPTRLLGAAVTVLVLVDPLLVESIGFWMSVGATAGVLVLSEPLRRALTPLGRLALPAATTIAAQVGVTIPAAAVFGVPPAIGVLANLLAVPVAGFVMLYGMPAALISGSVAGHVPLLGGVLMLPVAVAVRWIDAVAAAGARLQLDGRRNLAAWAVIAVAVVLLGRCSRRRRGRGTTGLGVRG